ncbi:tetratricopeptide repeat protein [Ruficoccus amylovorans]|uniref:Tetratricopeptide repeat protein n=1 Tax=Ruficoccus amylovorans TaxID=1804625 RepID=A0A842H9W8_9BACT|nr:O-antigen ligase family protein [Ruficoccus amylovorans]MBC2592898.1 tetratricopeptide repeat protein [Ruficoccus amylovorans]
MQFRVFLIGELTLSNLLDWLITLTLGGILCFNIWQLGGVRAETQLMTAWMCGGLLLLHGLWFAMSAREGVYMLQRSALLLVPFVAYALVQWLLLSPVPWEARRDFIVILEGFIVFWVAVHNLRKREQVWLLLAIICFFGALMIMPAFNQSMRRPDWSPAIVNPMDGRSYGVKLSAAFAGKAAGSMGSPAAFAGLMLLIISPLLVGAFGRRLNPPVRFFCFFLALLAMYALVLTQSLPAILAMTCGLLMCPFLLATRPKWKLYSFLCALLVPVAGIGYLYFTQSGFKDSLVGLLDGTVSDPRPVLWLVGIKNFLADPILGQGMSAYAWFFELHRPAGFNYNPLYAHNAYVNFISDFGLIGVVCAAPVVWMVVRSCRALAAQPQFVLLEHPNKRKVSPHRRMFLTATLMALFAFAVQLFFEFNLRVPALLFIAAIYLAIMVKCQPADVYKFKAGPLTGLLCLGTALVATVFLLSISSQYLLAQAYGFESERLLEKMADNLRERQTPDPILAEDTLIIARRAVESDPDNPRLLTDLARAFLSQSYVYPSRHAEFGALAEEQIRQALDISPDYMEAWIALGTAKWMQGDYAGSGEAYRRATEIAPNSPVAWYHLSAYLNIDPDTRAQALEAIERVLELNPDDPTAQSMRMKILIP